jgi:methylenetetrahydrofolate dehydrogenase (NADP+)/methenyltetrahydrofolate cyclohydrolase
MILDGKKIAEKIKGAVKLNVDDLRKKGKTPCLAVVRVGDDPASLVYVRNKKRACESVGIVFREIHLRKDVTASVIGTIVDELNNDDNVTGILVQLPLPDHLDENAVIDLIDPEKDVDGFTMLNAGLMLQGTPVIAPCTPAGIVELLYQYEIPIAGKHCVIVGRSNIVGKPLAMLMLKEDATVTVCHSKTEHLSSFTRQADILVSAVGKPYFITADMVKPGAVVIDVGINRDEDGKLVGDVDFAAVERKASYITPVPGGVGPMTVAMLMDNLLQLARQYIL